MLIENLNFAFTVDENDTVLRNASVVVEDTRITDIGPAGTAQRRPQWATPPSSIARRDDARR